MLQRHRSSLALAALAVALSVTAAACGASVTYVPCDEGFESCEGECVALASDPNNCGACGNACAGGQACSQGFCGDIVCAAPDVDCNGECSDLLHDHDDCGSCGVDCGAMFCENGSCVESCTPGLATCDGSCIDTLSDPDNCGNCGIVCPNVCVNGTCAATCSGGLTECNGACVDTFTNPQSCGFCGNVCPSGLCQQAGCVDSPCDEPVCGICEVATLPSSVPFSITGNTSFAADSFVPPCTGTAANEVLHVFTAPVSDFYSFDSIGTEYDSVLAMLDPDTCSVVDCNDDTFGVDAQVGLFLNAGQTIYVVMDGFDNGFYQLTVNNGSGCPGNLTECDGNCVDTDFDQLHCGGCFNACDFDESCQFGFCETFCGDECGACNVVDLPSVVPQTFSSSTSGLDDVWFPSCGFGSSSEQVHRFFAPTAGSYTFSTAGSGFDTVLSVLDSFSCGELGCNDNFGGFATSSVTVPLGADQPVLIAVDGNGVSGAYDLSISSGPPPMCPTAALGATLPITVSGSTAGAINAFSSSCSPGANAPDNTYTFTAPASQQYTIDTIGSSYDTIVHVLDGTCAGTSLACDDDAGGGTDSLVSLFLNAGQTVTIVVDGFGGNFGSYVLHVQ
jgi:hypothetical protein